MSTSLGVLKSSGFLLLIRLIQRGMGVISTILLARLLTPEDFGIVAIAITIIYFIEAVSSLGSEQYIIQKAEISESTLHTAWTVDFILKSIILVGFLIAVPFIGEFYGDPRLEMVLYVSSSIILINGLKNPGTALLRRNFDYKPLFKLSVAQKFFSFIIVIGFALVAPSYWAMVIGDVVSALIFTLGSYWIHVFRPKLSILGFREQWLFSKWMILRGFVGYTRSQFDTFIVSTAFSTQQLGGYHLVRQLSIMPSTEIIAPAVEPLLAAFSRSKDKLSRVAYQFRISFLMIVLLTMPIAGYLWQFPEPIVDTILGPKWVSTYEYLSAFSLFFISISLIQVMTQLSLGIGHLKSLFVYEVITLVLIVVVLWLVKDFSLYNFILVRGGLGIITLSGLLFYLSSRVPIRLIYLSLIVLPVLISVGISLFLTKTLIPEYSVPFLFLVSSGSFYLFVYVLMVIALYQLVLRNVEEWTHLKQLLFEQLGKLKSRMNS
jgi:lipopolysaccharide exporter